MKNLKLITAIMLTSLLSFTSCQDEIDNENGQNPNTNSANSRTAKNLERSSMHDGSFDDFLDGVSCSSVLLPVTATVNGTQVAILNQIDYQQVLNIFGEFNDDDDTVVFQFPITVQLSNYTTIVVSNQTEYNALIDACEEAENEAEDAISCLDINFPITILTYSLNFEQTGSIVLESEQELYTYMDNFESGELFAVSYPITATLSDDTEITINSDIDLQSSINDCLDQEELEEEAEEEAEALEDFLVETNFKVQSFINSGVETANDYVEYTIDFANDLTVEATNVVNVAIENVEGTYQITSETEVFLNLTFTGNTTFNLLNHTWKVTSFNSTSVSLKSTTDAAVILILNKI